LGQLGVAAIRGHVKAYCFRRLGVPLVGNFPIHRLSHDYFTHWSSAVLGSGNDSFYADPPVEHLEMAITANCSGMLHSDVGTQACASDCYRFFDYAKGMKNFRCMPWHSCTRVAVEEALRVG